MNIGMIVRIILMLKNSKAANDNNYLMNILADDEKSKKRLNLVSFTKAKRIFEDIFNNFMLKD